MKIMQPLRFVHNQHEEPSFIAPSGFSGPIPKSDSVQSLVSLMNCSSGYASTSSSSDPPTIRGIDDDANTHSILLDSELTSISFSALSLETVTLTALLESRIASQIREISLSANSLEHVDLSPLSSCINLSVLTLNSNRIASIDLSALSSCTKLERLWLHDNQIESIDLSPISSCKTLRSLYLEDNSLHSHSIDLSPLSQTQNLRSLRLGGNRLAGQVDLTPLLQCPALSVFQIDTSITLVADGQSSQARVSPALRRIVLDIQFTGKVVPDQSKFIKHRTTPPVTPRGGPPPAARARRKQGTSPSAVSSSNTKRTPNEDINTYQQQQQQTCSVPKSSSSIVNVLLVGFRRLARYAVEDAFSRTGKVVIRAADNSVATSDPQLVLDSHLVLLYTPTEKTLRNITVVVGRIPTVILGTGRYRSTATNKMMELLDLYKFCNDPMNEKETKEVYEMGLHCSTNSEGTISPSSVINGQDSVSMTPLTSHNSSNNNIEQVSSSFNLPLHRSHSTSSLEDALRPIGIEIEDIEDTDDDDDDFPRSMSQTFVPRAKSSDGFDVVNELANVAGGPAKTWSEVMRRLREQGQHRLGRGWGSHQSGEMSMHGRNKVRAERAAVAAEFSDLGGYATAESCIGVARAIGLPKCAASSLFRAAYGSSFEIESTTPEAGIPNPPLERKRKISSDSFLAYWDARLKGYDGEERLSNVLEDSHHSQFTISSCSSGHSEYGAPMLKARSINSKESDMLHMRRYPFKTDYSTVNETVRPRTMTSQMENLRRTPSDIGCPCDAGIEQLIISFMEARSSRFGSFSLVKMSEAIAIGSALVMFGIRGCNHHRVGGHARPVCPKEIRVAKLNAALIAAEMGIFEGVAEGLSMDKIRSIKGLFAAEASPDAISRNGGLALNYDLQLEEIQRFCATRKTLLPGAVELVMGTHCRNPTCMSLAEFAILLNVLNNISSDGAIDYFFTIIDVDHNERWTLPDLRHLHMEKEKLWLKDGMAISDLLNVWVNLNDMIHPMDATRGITRREFRKLGVRERKHVIQSLLFVDDDHSLLNIRMTVELNKQSADSVLVM